MPRFDPGEPAPVGSSRLLLEALARTNESPPAGEWVSRECTRCRSVEDKMRAAMPSWKPGVCQSWVWRGVRYWSSLCKACAGHERKDRVARAVGHGEMRDVAEERYGKSGGPYV